MSIHRVRSAGFLLCRWGKDGMPFFLIMRSSRYRFWGFPKGTQEKGEDDLATAVREVGEETGISDFFVHIGFKGTHRYSFTRGRVSIVETVHLFGAETRTQKVVLSREQSASRWLPYRAARSLLTFPDTQSLLDRFHEHLLTAKKSCDVQRAVYVAVAGVPKGKITSYRALARALSLSPRVVAAALSLNWDRSVPCHRVIHDDGRVGGYNRGTENKINILRKEGIRISGRGKDARAKDSAQYKTS